DEVANKALRHPDPFVRLWAVRLLGDEGKLSAGIDEVYSIARHEPNVEVRAQLACTAKRLPASQAMSVIVQLLTHAEDVHEPRIPLLPSCALESMGASGRATVLPMFSR